MRVADTRLLACPRTGRPLRYQGTNLELSLADGALVGDDDGPRWPVVDGFPQLFDEQALRGTDRLMRHIHDRIPRAHRPFLRALLPLLQGGGTESGLRDATLELLRLDRLRADGDRPARILEVGVGEGQHVPLVHACLPATVRAELWGVDLSETLLRRCRERWQNNPFDEQARLVLADAHHLPFPDGSFDRVFHVGGLGRFADPQQVLDELARVCAPGGRVVVVGKRLDPVESQAPPFQAAYRLLTMHEPDVDSARLRLPDGATDVVDEQVSRFFAGLAFSLPG
ncbi:MAG: class I SAM-dependent methyltransferase [Alphaproteobacteria bacterium]|nr:class I SAM-dependent methyltransferase [Alphaproteobacteria bacterium]